MLQSCENGPPPLSKFLIWPYFYLSVNSFLYCSALSLHPPPPSLFPSLFFSFSLFPLPLFLFLSFPLPLSCPVYLALFFIYYGLHVHVVSAKQKIIKIRLRFIIINFSTFSIVHLRSTLIHLWVLPFVCFLSQNSAIFPFYTEANMATLPCYLFHKCILQDPSLHHNHLSHPSLSI